MKKLLILSGKGGTGKTTTAAAFIDFLHAVAVADCDVDAPNLHLLAGLQMQVPACSKYLGSQKAAIDSERCRDCGICQSHCRFGAIRRLDGVYCVDEFSCEGCGVCLHTCPHGAVTMKDDVAGALMLYGGRRVFSMAKLKMGRGNSGKLVTKVKAELVGAAPGADLAIIDGSPGIGCPVIASISGVDLVLIVTEPSLSGISDLERILRTVAGFDTKAAVCVNKYDICLENSDAIERYCAAGGIPFVGRIPYDRYASQAVNSGRSLAGADCAAGTALAEVFQKTMGVLSGISSVIE